MNVLLVVETGRTRRWMADLAADLAALGLVVRVRVTDTPPPATIVALALELDRLVSPRPRRRGHEAVAAAAIAPPPEDGFAPDAVVDFSAAPRPVAGATSFAVAWSGACGEDALVGAVTAGPIEATIFDVATGAVLERVFPSFETVSGLTDAVGVCGARAATALAARLAARARGRDRGRPDGTRIDLAPARRPDLVPTAKATALRLARFVYHLACRAPHWRVGWRMIDGPGLLDGAGFAGPVFRPIADPGTHFYADPFVVVVDGRSWVLVEDLDHATDRGRIAAIPFDDEGPCGPAVPVLEEPWHLSYPFPITIDGVLHIMPESSTAGDLGLYRCIAFPDRWERVATLVEEPIADATVVEHAGRWWMFSTLDDGRGGWSDLGVVHHAPSPTGPWRRLDGGPATIDARLARPAGRAFVRDGRLFRPVQDCSRTYGGAVHVVETTRLDETALEQTIRFTVAPGPHWPGGRLHAVDRVGRLEVIDGAVVRPKWDALDRLVAPRFEPRSPA